MKINDFAGAVKNKPNQTQFIVSLPALSKVEVSNPPVVSLSNLPVVSLPALSDVEVSNLPVVSLPALSKPVPLALRLVRRSAPVRRPVLRSSSEGGSEIDGGSEVGSPAVYDEVGSAVEGVEVSNLQRRFGCIGLRLCRYFQPLSSTFAPLPCWIRGM
jgi:hypothetical protein